MKTIPKYWWAIWGTMYLCILVMNLFFLHSGPAKVISCLAIALNIPYSIQKSPRDHLLHIALAFTLLADTVLAVNTTAYLGVFIFAFAQFFHFARLTHIDPRYFLVFLLMVTLITYLTPLLGIDSMFIIGTFYACLLASNLVLSITWYQRSKTKNSRSAMLGFILFTLCDLCVAASFFANTGHLPHTLAPFADYLSWVFYYPSQVLLSNSSNSKSSIRNHAHK